MYLYTIIYHFFPVTIYRNDRLPVVGMSLYLCSNGAAVGVNGRVRGQDHDWFADLTAMKVSNRCLTTAMTPVPSEISLCFKQALQHIIISHFFSSSCVFCRHKAVLYCVISKAGNQTAHVHSGVFGVSSVRHRGLSAGWWCHQLPDPELPDWLRQENPSSST